MSEFEPGQTFHVPFPFVRGEYEWWEEIGETNEYGGPECQRVMRKTWNPGVDRWQEGPDSDTAYADGEGRMVLTVISTHKPGRFPERVFYTRTWITPDGKPFGRANCRVCVVEKFRRLIRGYAHDYVVDSLETEPTPEPAREAVADA